MTSSALNAKLTQVSGTTTVNGHRYTVLEPNDPTWIDVVAEAYRELRIATNFPAATLSLNGVDVIDTTKLRTRLIQNLLPTRRPPGPQRQLAVERSDLAEVVLGMLGAELRDYQYGYRSTRDRELVAVPGRSIDQVGVVEVGDKLVISLGEAKVSSSSVSPPSVVDSGNDSLRSQHRGHLADVGSTAQKLYAAARNSTDEVTQHLLHLAGVLWEDRKLDVLLVRSTSMLVRPAGSMNTDFGTHMSRPNDYAPGKIDFFILHVPEDLESVVDEFLAKAREEWVDVPLQTQEGNGD